MNVSKNRPSVVVIGGGLHGCCVALHLARAGATVTLVERDDPGRHASGVNAGGVRTLNRHLAEIPLALAALEIWRRMGDEVGDTGGYVESGQVRVAESEPDLETISQRVKLLNESGYTHETLIGSDALRKILPAAAPHCIGAIFCPREGHADPYRTTQAYFRATERAGVAIRLRTAVTALESKHGGWDIVAGGERLRADIVVNCSGAWAGEICALAGDHAELIQDALMMMATQPRPKFVGPVVGCAGRPLSLKQLADGTVIIGGGYKGHVDPRRGGLIDEGRLALNLRTAVQVFPVLADIPIARSWTGIEGRTSDQLPVIGWSPRKAGLFHIFGFSGHGFALGPIVGKLAARAIVNEAEEPLFSPFDIGRLDTCDPKSRHATTE